MADIPMVRLFAIFGLVLFHATAGAAEDPALPSPARPGRYTLVIKSGDYDRVARVHVPKSYQPGSKPPLVLLLHGAGGSGAGMLDKDNWAAKADKEGFVAVAPDGLPARPNRPADFRTNPPLWNSGQLQASSPRAAVDDVAFLGRLLDTVIERLHCDKKRVFCCGHSNGGAMTFRLAAELSDRFTAVGTVAGLLSIDDPQPKRPVPTLYILGTKDPLMPMDGGEVKLPWGTRENPPVDQPLATWAAALGCRTEPKTISDRDGVKLLEYPSLSDGPTLKVMYLAGHGHHWPGGQRTALSERMLGPITSKLNATDALWEFFQTCAGKGSE